MLFYDPANNDPRFCRNIRTKMSYVPGSSEDPAHLAELSSTAIHWCVCTQGAVGPDGRFVTPYECGSERACFETTEVE
jgi:hypothetical protein